MNFFKLYIGDYQRDTAHLSIAEHGAYVLMLQHYYATEKPLPKGKALHRMLRAQDKRERDAIDAIAQEFWSDTPDGLVNERADEEITKANAQAETNARIAREREARRKASREDDEASTKRATNDQPNQTPDTRHQREAKASLGRASRLPETWAPSDDEFNFALCEGLTPDEVDREAAKFRDYWHGKGGKDGRKADWKATWRNWVRNSRDRGGRRDASGGTSSLLAGLAASGGG